VVTESHTVFATCCTTYIKLHTRRLEH
jgi:hypothetical protein